MDFDLGSSFSACAMRYGLYNEAFAMIKDLLASSGGDSRNLLLAARWSIKRGTPPQTIIYATRTVSDDPANKTAVLFLAALEITNPYLHQKAVDLLLPIIGSGDESARRALWLLVSDPDLKAADIDRVIAQLQSHPPGNESERIDTLTLEIKRSP